jgi:hypothetical protein
MSWAVGLVVGQSAEMPSARICAPQQMISKESRPAQIDGGLRREVADWASAGRLVLRLPANRPVGEFTDQVGVPVVAGVLLDHVDVDPAQGAGFTRPGKTGVVKTAGSGRVAARLVLGQRRTGPEIEAD